MKIGWQWWWAQENVSQQGGDDDDGEMVRIGWDANQ